MAVMKIKTYIIASITARTQNNGVMKIETYIIASITARPQNNGSYKNRDLYYRQYHSEDLE